MSILFICFWTDLVRVFATTANTFAVAGYTRVFHGLRKERLAQWLPICVQDKTKNALQIMRLAAYASETNNSNVVASRHI